MLRCQLPIESNDAVYSQLPNSLLFNETFPWNDKLEKWSQCYRYNETGSDVVVDCGGKYIYDRTKYESSAFMDVRFFRDGFF